MARWTGLSGGGAEAKREGGSRPQTVRVHSLRTVINNTIISEPVLNYFFYLFERKAQTRCVDDDDDDDDGADEEDEEEGGEEGGDAPASALPWAVRGGQCSSGNKRSSCAFSLDRVLNLKMSKCCVPRDLSVPAAAQRGRARRRYQRGVRCCWVSAFCQAVQ